MSRLSQRLDKAEAAVAGAGGPFAPQDVFARIATFERWLLGQGQRPELLPCPSGHDPVTWASSQRIIDNVGARTRGELPAGRYLPGTSDEEGQAIDAMMAD
jgi:hypothetical protein